jgi:prepilin-type N-terminal cleavage/methylation domain-containing protein
MFKKIVQHKIQAGFTLIEILVTVTLTAIIMLGITSLFISLMTSAGKSRMSQSLRENGTVAMQRMIEELRNAKAIDSSMLTCDGSTPNSSIIFTNNNDEETISSLSADNNRIKLTTGSNNYFLTSDTNELRGLEFICYNSSEGAKYIEINFTLASSAATANSPTHSQLDFKSGVALRN